MRLWRPKGPTDSKGPTKLVLARQLAEMIAERFGDRQIHVVADAAYVGRALRGLPERITWTVRLRRSAVCYGLAHPQRAGGDGRG